MAIDKKLICFARLEEFERQLAAGNILDKSIVFIQDANKIYNRGTYYDCQSPYVLPFGIETLDGLSYSDNEGRLQTDADVFEKAKSAIEMGRMVVIRYGLSDAGYHICDATYNGDAISVRVYNGLMLYSFEIYASSQGSIIVEQYSLQSELVDGVNIATINGKSLTAGGDLTIEGGAKVYEWFYDGEAESVTLSQEEYDNIVEADLVIVNIGIMSFAVSKSGKEVSEAAGIYFLVGQVDIQGNKIYVHITISISTKLATITLEQQEIPTKTSQLENDSDFVTPEDVAAVALSGSYNDLQDTPTIPSAVTESTVSGWGFTKNTGTYSKPSGGIPKSDLASAVQTSLGKADTALQSYTEQYKGTVTGVKINGTTKNPSSGVVDLGTVITDVSNLATKDEAIVKDVTGELITAHTQALYGGGSVYALPDQANGDEDDILLSKNSVKTINGQSILGSGNISISGGSGGGSGAYAEVNHGTSDTTFTLTPNTFHVWDEVSSLTLTLGSETSGVANEYLFQFTSGSEPTTLTMSDDIKLTEDLVIEPNKIYQVSILKGLASVLSWENAAELVENKLEIVKSGKSYIINSQYPVESSLKIVLSNSPVTSITFPAGSSSYRIGSGPTTPSISAIDPSEDNTYKYIW